MRQFILIALAVLALMVAATLRVLWWFWVEHEQAVQRERIRQRAQGLDAEIVKFRPVRERYKEQGK